MKHRLLPLSKRSIEKDESYAVLGRALAYATDFENNCRKLAHLFEIEETEKDFSWEIWGLMNKGTLFQKINSLVETHNFPKWSAEEIHNARKGRNYIAHEAAKNHFELLESVKGRREFKFKIVSAITDITLGNQIVLDSYQLIKSGKTGSSPDMVAYDDAVYKWVSERSL